MFIMTDKVKASSTLLYLKYGVKRCRIIRDKGICDGKDQGEEIKVYRCEETCQEFLATISEAP